MELGGVNPTKQTQPVQDKPITLGGVDKPTTAGNTTLNRGGVRQIIKK